MPFKPSLAALILAVVVAVVVALPHAARAAGADPISANALGRRMREARWAAHNGTVSG